MTEQSNAELIAEVNEKLASHQWTSDWGIEMLAGILAERLEAVERERDNWKLSAEEATRAEKRWRARAEGLAAVVEKVRAARANHPECELYDGDDAVSCGWKSAVIDIDTALATPPADALREHDAALIDSLMEGIGSGTYTRQVGTGIEVALDQLHTAKAELREGQS